MNTPDLRSITIAAGLIGLAAAVPAAAHDVSLYPTLKGGEWRRTENLKDTQGRFQARQEHTALEANGFVYVINGFVPQQPPPTPTEEDPEPFLFKPTNETLVYVPAGHPAAPESPAANGGFSSEHPGSRRTTTTT
jgi:hypothetical protein